MPKIVVGGPSDVQSYKTKILVKNIIQCKLCGDKIESRETHNFVQCSCKRVALDGGLDYCRTVGNQSDFEYLQQWYVE